MQHAAAPAPPAGARRLLTLAASLLPGLRASFASTAAAAATLETEEELLEQVPAHSTPSTRRTGGADRQSRAVGRR